MSYAIYYRKQILVNTDPQRRCYDGCNFSEELVWGTWNRLYGLPTLEEAQESVDSWRRLNPKAHQYEMRLE